MKSWFGGAEAGQGTAGSSALASQNQNKDVSKAGYLALGSGEECTSKLYFRLCTEFDSLW